MTTDTLRGGTPARLKLYRERAKRYGAPRDNWREHRYGLAWLNGGAWCSREARAVHMDASIAASWRDRGDSHDIVDMRHTGWFKDAHQSETICGHVWQWPARNGSPVYVAGIEDKDGGSVSLVATRGNVDTFDDEDDAARAADEYAERVAESEREYNEKWHAMRDAEQAIEDAHAEMRTIRRNVAGQFALLRLGKGERETVCDYVFKLREEFAELIERVAEHRDTISDLTAQGIE